MKIRLAVIPPDDLASVRAEVDILRGAVDSGDMDGMDAATEKLLPLTNGFYSMDLSEEEWQKILTGIRIRNPEFQSDYLLPGKVVFSIFPDLTSDTMVLQLPFDEKEGDDV